MGEKNTNSIYTGMGEMMRVYIVMNRYADTGKEIEYVAETYEKAYDYVRRNHNSLFDVSIYEWEVR